VVAHNFIQLRTEANNERPTTALWEQLFGQKGRNQAFAKHQEKKSVRLVVVTPCEGGVLGLFLGGRLGSLLGGRQV